MTPSFASFSIGSTTAAASTSAHTSRPRSCGGCVADGRHFEPNPRRLFDPSGGGSGRVRPSRQQPPHQGHGVLPRPEAFRVLRDHVLPELIAEARREKRELRIWSPVARPAKRPTPWPSASPKPLASMCVAGSPYLRDRHRPRSRRHRAQGIYPAAASRPAGSVRDRHFGEAEGGFQVAKRLRALMVFGEHDLGNAPIPTIDLLLVGTC